MKKISFGLLDELAKDQEKISELEMKSLVGGGCGSPTDPYSVEELDALLDSNQWTGGYVEYLGYVAPSVFIYGGYYGDLYANYHGSVSDFTQTLIESGLDQLAGTLISMIPYLGVGLDYYAQEIKDCKTQMLSEIIASGQGNNSIDFVASPGTYSSSTTQYMVMSAYDSLTGTLLTSYKIYPTGTYEKIN